MREIPEMKLFYSALATAVLTCSGAIAQDRQKLRIEKTKALDTAGETVEFEVGRILVPENRSKSSSRKIGVGFARFRGPKDSKAPPMFLLPGGPGFSFISDMLERGSRGFVDQIKRYASVGDLVIVDQRGCSTRGEVLSFSDTRPALGENERDDEARRRKLYRHFAKQAVQSFEGRDVDLSGYTVLECAHDVDALRAALGYERITLIGTSFGSQWSFAFMRLHPDRVARALLSGVEPLDHSYDMPSDVYAAYLRMWRSAESDPKFRPYLPEGGIAAAVSELRARLDRSPLSLGERDGREYFYNPVDLWLANPKELLEVYHGHYVNCRARIARSARSGRGNPRILSALVDSSLYVTPARLALLWNDPATRFTGRMNFARYVDTKDIWPTPDVGDAFRTAQRSEIPVVFAQGDWDTSTPIENLYEIAPYFVNSHVILAERGGHGVLRPIATQLPKVWAQIEDFLRTGDREGLPVRVRLAPSRRFEAPSFDIR